MSAVELQRKAGFSLKAVLARRGVLIAAALLVGLVAFGIKGWRVYGRLDAVRADARAIQQLTRSNLDQATLTSLEVLLAKTRADTIALRAEAAPLLPLTYLLGWLPVYGGDLASAELLIDFAVDVSAAADEAFAAFGPLLADQDNGSISGEQVRVRIVESRPQIDRARAALSRAVGSWSRIPIQSLSPSSRGQLEQVGQMLPLAQLGLEVAPTLPALLDDLQRLEMYRQGQPDTAMLIELGPLLQKTRADVAALHTAAAPVLVNRPGDSQAPGAAELAAIEPLLNAAVDLSVAADETYQALAPLIVERDTSQPLGVAVTEQLVAARPQLESARDAADRAANAWDRVDFEALPPLAGERLGPVGGLLPALRDGLDLALALPDMLGARGPARYLLLAQNPDELRATGGFIGAVGVLTIDKGQPGAITMRDSPTVDDVSHKAYAYPPQPMLRYMNIEMWLFRDANWSPDFPTAAQQARELYWLGRGLRLDNVIAFDPYAIQEVLEVIGPVSVEGAAEPITAENVWSYLRSEHGRETGTLKKAYIGQLANTLVEKAERNPDNLDLWKLVSALHRVLDERHLLLAIPDTTVAPILGRHGWDGAVRPGPDDFLMVVDTNMGYNKVNANIKQEIRYQVDLSEPSAPVATLTVRHIHALQQQEPCVQFDDSIEKDTYAGWMERCHYSFLRVLVPSGSQLIAATTQPVPDAWMDSGRGDTGAVHLGEGEAGTSVLSVFQVVAFGEQHEMVFRYRLPPSVLVRDEQGWQYRLRVQKQAGTDAIPLAVEIKLPVRAKNVVPGPLLNQNDSWLYFTGDLSEDRTVAVTFQPH